MNRNTSCKDCYFAIYEGITQVGCLKNRVEKYKHHGCEVLEAYDEEKEFYVIKNRICPFYRDLKWAERVGKLPEDRINRIVSYETMIKVHLIIFIKDSYDINLIKNTINSLNIDENNVCPIRITVVKPKNIKIDINETKKCLDESRLLWRIENLVVEKDITEIIHMVQKTTRSQYYCVCDAGFIFPENYFKKINHAVLEDLLQFGIIESGDDCDNGYVIPIHVHNHWYFYGDVNKTIPENIREYQCKNQDQKIVCKFQNL